MPLAGRQNLSNVPAGAQRRAARRSNAALRRGAGMSVTRRPRGQVGGGAPGGGGGGRTQTRPKSNVGGRPARGQGPGGGNPGPRGPMGGAMGGAAGAMGRINGAFGGGPKAQFGPMKQGGPRRPTWKDMQNQLGGGNRPSPWGNTGGGLPSQRPGGAGQFRTLPGINQRPMDQNFNMFPGGPQGLMGMLGSKGGGGMPGAGGMHQRPGMTKPFLR